MNMENTKGNEQFHVPEHSEPTPPEPDQPGPDNATAAQESNSGTNERDISAEESQQQDLSLHDEPTLVAAPDQPGTGNGPATPDVKPEKTAAEIRAEGGRDAHYKAQLTAAVLGKAVGAKRLGKFSNHHQLDGEHFQIRTISGSQNTFTVNVDTEPPSILVLQKNPGENRNDSRFLLFGVLRDDAVRVSLPSSSKGHATSGHRQVSLRQVLKVALGEVFIPSELVAAKTSQERLEFLAKIDALADAELAPILTDKTGVEQFLGCRPPAELSVGFALDCVAEAIEFVRSIGDQANPWSLIESALESMEAAKAALQSLYPVETIGAKLPLDESEGSADA
jgi:hypothetical protein